MDLATRPSRGVLGRRGGREGLEVQTGVPGEAGRGAGRTSSPRDGGHGPKGREGKEEAPTRHAGLRAGKDVRDWDRDKEGGVQA